MCNRAHLLLPACLIALAGPALALDQNDRMELADLLVMDDQAVLADADEAYGDIQARLFEAESELDVAMADYKLVAGPVEEVAEELEAAQLDLQEAAEAEAPDEEIADLEDQVLAAQEWMEEAAAEVEPYEAVRLEAQEAFDALRQEYADAHRAFNRARSEILQTKRFVEALDERRATALYSAMLDAADQDLLPLDIDLDVLELIADKQLGRRAIEQLPSAFDTARKQGGDGVAVFLCLIGDDACPGRPAESGEAARAPLPAAAQEPR